MKKQIFRQAALDQLSSAEQLDQLGQVTSPRGWLALLGLIALLLTVVLWAFVGTIPTKVVSQGILIRTGGVNRIVATTSGQLNEFFVERGEVIEVGQVVANLSVFSDSDEETVPLISPYRGRILEITVNQGTFVEQGTLLLSLIDESQALEAVIYLAPAEGKQLSPGMAVEISPATVQREEYGFMLGKVKSVGEFPATYEGMFRVLGNDELVKTLSAGEAPIEVRVELEPDEQTVSGYKWSSPKGPPISMTSGTFCSTSITISEQRPISLVIP